MGRRIVALSSVLLTIGLSVPLALGLAQTPEPTPTVPAQPAPPPAADPGPPPLPAPGDNDLLQDAIQGDAPPTKPKALPGPKSLTLPAAKRPRSNAAAPLSDPSAFAVEGQGEIPKPPAPEPAPAASAGDPGVTPLPNHGLPAAPENAPAALPIAPADAHEMPPGDEGAARDAQLRQSQAPLGLTGETSPLPPARNPGGKPATIPAPGSEGPDGLEAFVLPADQLPLGRQTVGLTVDVVSPGFLNLNQEASLKLVVKNTGSTDAKGVVVRDELPAGVQFQSSQPIAQQAVGSPLLVWRLGTVAAGSERVILLRVVPKKVGAFEHAATVTMQAGAKARTLVREPRLKVEQIVSSVKVLKGQQVEWRIYVSNTGNGPARHVIVQAKLSAGLRHESGEPNEQNLFEQELDVLEPGQRVALDPLVTDAILEGPQSCTVGAQSPDVSTGLEEARNTQTVNVVTPKLAMTVAGPDKKFTFMNARYVITLTNPGTATARKVQVLVNVPVHGQLLGPPSGAHFDPATRKLAWNLAQLDPGEKATFSFQVKMGGAGSYQVAADGHASGGLHVEGIKNTIVEGYADLDMEVTAAHRVVDVGDMTTFQIKIVNKGTKEATQLLIKGQLSKNLEAKEVNIENNEQAGYNRETRQLVFPKIDRLGPGKQTTLNVTVLVLPDADHLATFRVELMHSDLAENEKIEDVGDFRISPARTIEK